MKQLITLVILLAFFFSCKNDQSSNESQTNTDPGSAPTGIFEKHMAIDPVTGAPGEVYRPANAISSTLAANPIKEIDPVKPVVKRIVPTTPEEENDLKAFTNRYWVIWGLVRIGRQVNKVNQGGYFKFNEDGTYEFGKFGEKICNGAWSFDAVNKTISLDSELLGDDREWTYTMQTGQQAMVWIGTPKYFLTDVQLKLDNYYNNPKTRAEAALPDFE